MLAGALNHLREELTRLGRPLVPIAENGMPVESEYADDVNFLDEDPDKLRSMLPICNEFKKIISVILTKISVIFTINIGYFYNKNIGFFTIKRSTILQKSHVDCIIKYQLFPKISRNF